MPIQERPRYHFQPNANWMSDPNGPIHWRGQYHLFYQHNPSNPFFGPMCWGHAVSSDLVRWTHLPIALAPTPGDPDADGCWSGCAVDDGGTPTLIYTGVVKDAGYQASYRQTQCLAVSDDNLLTWRKDPRNPVIPAPPEGDDITVTGFRDPCVWREEGGWACVIGSGVEGVGGHILLYRSPDLRHWNYVGRLYSRSCRETSPVWTGSIFECPQFFALGDRHVLIFAVWDEDRLHHTVAMVGDFDGRAFTPRDMRRLDLGADYYAPSVMRDEQGRHVLWGWSWEARRSRARLTTGWAGMMALPRVLTLRSAGLLGVAPVPELELLRRDHRQWRDLTVAPDAANPLDGVDGDALEILLCLDMGSASSCMLVLRRSPDGEECTIVRYERATGALMVDRERSSLDPAARRGAHGGPIPPGEDGSLTLHVFLDRTIVEVYANGQGCITERIYPTRSDSIGVALEADGGPVTVRSLDIWTVAPAGTATLG
ncbi:MAG: glycoside hydrolase family 32 protein [Chloroflexota bacterium]